MPNHCTNDLWIIGNEREVSEFLDFARSPDAEFDFNKFIHYPEHFAKMDRDKNEMSRDAFFEKYRTHYDGFNSGGYEWVNHHWGTKWNAYDVARRDYTGHVCLTFKTAWSPPIPVIEAAHAKFPHLELSLEFIERSTKP